MPSLSAVVLGATGLIGEQVVQNLLQNGAFNKVRILVRRPVQLVHPKLEVQLVNFDDLQDYENKLGTGDCIFCCIGTTQQKEKGDKQAYRKVDYDIPVNAAKLGKDAGFSCYIFVSSVGANAKSGNFYLSLKGEVELAIESQNFASLHLFRPGLLLGKREEFRFGELIGKLLMSAFSFLLIGKYKKYKGIQSADVAKAMVQVAIKNSPGIHQYENKEIIEISNQS